jgi:RNA polymerase sigma factor (sigma-70 family)
MNNLSEFEIIESIKKGNQADFSLLVDMYKDCTFTLLKRMLKNDMDAEEALMDCFLKVYKSLPSFRYESKFSTWLYRITYNTALTVISGKKRKVEKEMSSLEDHYNLEDNDDEIYSISENGKQYLMNLVDKLPPRNALVIILFYIDNLSLNEISQVLQISLVNTKVLLHRSRNALREMLIKHNYQEEMI